MIKTEQTRNKMELSPPDKVDLRKHLANIFNGGRLKSFSLIWNKILMSTLTPSAQHYTASSHQDNQGRKKEKALLLERKE